MTERWFRPGEPYDAGVAAPTDRDVDPRLPWLGGLLVRSAAQPVGERVAASIALVVAAASSFALDWVTGPHLNLLVVYVSLVALFAWRFPPMVGHVMAVAGAAVGVAVALSDQGAVATHVVVVNGVFRLVVLLAISFGTSLLRRTLAALDQVGKVDPLTQLLNRRALWELGDRERARALRNGTPLVVAYFDLDGLKQVNDRRGHDAGDRLITDFATALRSELRSTDLIARLGGDEFAVVLPEVTVDNAVASIRRVLARPSVPSASVGIVGWESAFPEIATMIGEADSLMYDAKQQGAGVLHRQARAAT